MAVRFQNIIANQQGLFYKIQILDADFVGSSTDFQTVDVSFDYKGQNNNRWDSVWGSQVTVEAISTTAVDLTTLIDDIIQAEEGRFNLVVYKSSDGISYDFEWIGVILNDLSGGYDEAPNQRFTISAVDGLGALKGIDFNTNSTTPLSTSTAGFALIWALKKLPYNSFFASGDDFLKSCVKYFESEMPNLTGDPLNWTTIPNTTFYEIDKNGAYKWNSCYEVVDKICQLFNCRIYFGGGTWRLIDIRKWETASSVDVFTWTYAAAVGAATSSENVRYTIDETINGARIAIQSFDNFPPLKKIERKYLHDTSKNLIEGVTINTANGLQSVASVITSNTATFVFSGTCQVNLVQASPYAYQQVFVKLRLTVAIGSIYYLSRPITNQTQNSDYNSLEWIFNTVSYIEYIGVFNVNQYGGGNIPITFDTSTIPSSAAVNMNLEVVYIQDLQQNDISANYTASATLAGAYLQYVDDEAENERTYFVDNDTSAFFSEVAELKELNVGDKINPMTQNRLLVFDGSTNVDSTGNWGRESLSGTTELIPLVLEDIIAGQRTAIRKRQGQFVGAFNPWAVLAFSGTFYLPLGVRFSIKNGSFDGEWYLAGTYDDSGLSSDYVVAPVAGEESIVPPSVTPPAGGGAVNPVGVVQENGKITVNALTASSKPVLVNNTSGSEVFSVNGTGDIEAVSAKLVQTKTVNVLTVNDSTDTTQIIGMQEDSNGLAKLYINGYIQLNDVTAADVPNGCVFIDVSDGKLKFRDGSGTVHNLY